MLVAGFVPEATIPSGIHTRMMFSSVHRFSLKTQLMELTLNVPTNEGLVVELDGEPMFMAMHKM